jgi:hypothetical protein
MAALTPQELASSGTEHGHQAALFAAFATPDVRALYPELERLMFAIPNGGSRGSNKREAQLKAEGVKRGVSDIMVAVPRSMIDRDYHGLFVEMKTIVGVESDEQKAFGAAVTEQGYAYVVCRGWMQAYATIRAYMDGLL